MSESPNAVFGWLVAAAIALALAVGAAMAALGLGAVAALTATIMGALTACVFFVAELDHVPLNALLLVAFALASVAGFLSTVWAYLRERRLLAVLPLGPVADAPLARLARASGIRLYVTPARRPEAFCFGLLRPRVVVTSGLVERLNTDEQAAVLWHEARHACSREPLRCLLARLAANTFFWIPLLRGLLDRFLIVKEIAADRHAVARTSTVALASALHKVASSPSQASVGAGDSATARVERLFAPETALPPMFQSWQLIVSAVGATALAITMSFPAQIDVSEQTRLNAMMTSLSMHGLPGMAAGLAVNTAIFLAFAALWRRLRHARDLR